MKSLFNNDKAESGIAPILGIFITIIVAALVLFTVAGGIDLSTETERQINENVGHAVGTDFYNNSTYAANATAGILDQSETVFVVLPLIGIVMVAVLILAYISKIGD